jgi:predicted O-methyltransferase YrrM
MITREDIKMIQNLSTHEHQQFISWLFGYKPELEGIIEIGILRGATTRVLHKLLDKNGIYVGIDANILDEKENYFADVVKVAQDYSEDERMNFIIADSTDSKTIDKVKDVLDVRKVDLLLIDGEHSFKAARSDYDMYEQFVRSGGIIAWHDATCNSNVRRAIESILEVSKLRGSKFLHRIQFDSRQGHCGITALVKE